MAMAVLLGLGGLTTWGCRWSVRAFRRAQETARLVRAEHDGVLFHYPTRRDGRAVDVYVPADDRSQAA